MKKEKTVSAVDHVVDCLTEELISGALKPGDRLLPENELSQKYGVGRNSVREAIKQLQAFGILYIRRPDGTFVEESFTKKMLDPLLYSLIMEAHDWKDFVQLRAMIEIGTLFVALENADIRSVVPKMKSIIADMENEFRKPEPSIDRILDMDLSFHQQISNVLGNPQIDSINNYIAKLTVPSRKAAVQHWYENNQTDTFVDLHRQILNVISENKKDDITAVIQRHYVQWK